MNYRSLGALIVGIILMFTGICLLTMNEMGSIKIDLFQNLAVFLNLQKENFNMLMHISFIFVGLLLVLRGIGPSKTIGSIS